MTRQNPYYLSAGKHDTAEDGRCAMEWVSYLAGEPHTDAPVCVSPVLQSFCVSFNDGLDDENRQKLRPYLARTIGTAGDGKDDERAWMAMDWLIRVYTPTWLALVPSLREHAERLRALPPVLAVENVKRAMDDLSAARSDADAAGAAARAAARAAAGDAAWAAAWAAAGAAAWAAARAALAPTVHELQASAFALLDAMLPTEIIQLPVAADAELVCALLHHGDAREVLPPLLRHVTVVQCCPIFIMDPPYGIAYASNLGEAA